MKIFKIKSLRQKLLVFLLAPVALLLFAVGFIGFLYARNILLDAWKEAAVLKLQRAAHYIDMRLDLPIEWIQLFHETGGGGVSGEATPEWILERLRKLNGVAKVDLQWKEKEGSHITGRSMRGRFMRGTNGMEMMRFHHAKISEVTSPRFDTHVGQETVTLISQLKNEADEVVGTLDVTLRFDFLMQDILEQGWWQSDLAGLVDDSGRFLAHTRGLGEGRKQLGETKNPLELELLEAIHKRRFGTILGSGHPPQEVAGFYRIHNANWTLVLMAPGIKVLAPIIRFRFYYFLAGFLSIVVIILLIQSVTGNVARSIARISAAAQRVATGNYGEPTPVNSEDEIGQLAANFNTMVKGLKERDFISNTFGRYVDHEFAKELMRSPEASRLGGQRRGVVILMSDLRNFTPLSETLTPEQTIQMLNHYFSYMIDIIQRCHGIIIDFVGDAMLVFFDPLENPIEPSIGQALSCAFGMQAGIARFNRESRMEGLPELQMGIGIHAGEVVVGNIGSPARAKYGIVGAAVNLTQRIQSVAEPGEIALSETVYAAYRSVSASLDIKRSPTVGLKGVRNPVKLYIVNPPEPDL